MLTAVIALASLALLASFGLAVAARVFAVKVDPRVEAIEEALPGANCGACSLPGCSELSKQIAAGKADVDAYAQEVVAADFEEPGHEDVFRKVRGDLDAAGITVDDGKIRDQMDTLLTKAEDEVLGA